MYDDDSNDEEQPEPSREQRVEAAWPGAARPGFNEWLRKQVGRADPVGDLAEDMAADRRWPERAGVSAYVRYLDRRRACPEAIDAFLDAFCEFHKIRK